ncbi:pyrophosphatase PpaX [Paenibacillus sp. FSL R5-0887]|jgi:pyrophosphatase PpaX|uniref:Pyrophosphatase PpaX n=1 Tax=Paenibacillus odorifer TaxID=189426 RepID=A0A1R0X9S2_9BACL|nr:MULTISPECIES: pyrophosphatase PpaX [Paenibacillus]MDH6429620.1 pyrophosphatase PpaX [Paenibacillus sp. PastH-4]MDH6445829.1 pyrophosphatase PpaX [Paenibacillus sp. PastF-4]MDH6529715.1 pyrophosphatase PpaX [Paenibacillus sp. PastH-3]OMC63283.1 pyrophosphatase PpaX [Paenibacillus odorifer]OMC77172.1 pyrophosphatase PpaX [Paenibacillus odorifer]
MIECVLFDLDGTIVDTNELIISSFMYALKDNGLAPLTREEIIPHMGTTLQQQMRVFSGLEDVNGTLEKSYRSYNNEHHDELVRSFPLVKETIEELSRRGIKLGIVTTKIRPTTIKTLERFDLLKYMDTIVTVNDVTEPKPHPEPVLTAVHNLGVDPRKTLMIGDSAVDIQSAKAAGVYAAGVSWSLKGEDTLRKYDPDFIIHNMKDIIEIMERGTNES